MTPIYVLLAASIVQFIAVLLLPFGLQYHNGGYALSVGIISTVVTIVLILVQMKNPAVLTKELFSLPKFGAVSVECLFAAFLFVCNFTSLSPLRQCLFTHLVAWLNGNLNNALILFRL